MSTWRDSRENVVVWARTHKRTDNPETYGLWHVFIQGIFFGGIPQIKQFPPQMATKL